MRAIGELLLFIAIVVVDRITKAYALHACVVQRVITENLYFELTINRGMSWGMFHSSSPEIFWAVTAVVLGVITVLCWHTLQEYQKNESIIGHIMVLAGACSNVIDRFVYDGVIDFIAVSCFGLTFPAIFNGADIAIVVGVLIMSYHEWYKE